MKASIVSFVTFIAVTLAGCASSALEQNFGESVREMQASQRYTPPNATPRPQGHGPLDPAKAGAILEAYRTDVAKPQEVMDEIQIRMRAY